MSLTGTLNQFYRKTILVELVQCEGKGCYSPEQIVDRAQSIVFYIAVSAQQFRENKFHEDSIRDHYHFLRIEAGSIKLIRMERNELDARDSIWEPFSPPTVNPFLDFDVIDLPTDTILEPRWVTVHIEVTKHHMQVTRRNYTLFEFFGDVGALKRSLLEICSVLLGFFKI